MKSISDYFTLTAEFLKELAQVEKLDLTQNVFINGVWGHYRQVLCFGWQAHG